MSFHYVRLSARCPCLSDNVHSRARAVPVSPTMPRNTPDLGFGDREASEQIPWFWYDIINAATSKPIE
ncbi:hypothetical protein RRF57_002367 [Xylaria bambusicola]|uniref:Uncharacterized protein n=1 Tax=Xylaria bambusicola TaxID=326684 RepID=A0AAN7UF66_9PEZI